MNYRFYNVASSNEELKPVSLTRLASHVLTDWIPGVPQPAAAAFADILGTMLKSDSYLEPTWCTDPAVAGFERQWRIATSWIIGVAFCREVIEDFGYPFWAPVSALGDASSETSTLLWGSRLPAWRCRINRPDPPTSKFLPDYVVCSDQPNSQDVRIAFFESKGTRDAIDRKAEPPSSWRKQVENAELSFDDTVISPERRVVVATRVNPSAKRRETRRVVVRAWNGRRKARALSTAGACELVALHYYSLCRALRLEGTARALALAARLAEAEEPREDLSEEFADTMALLEREMEHRSQTFKLGDRQLTLRIGKFGEKALALLAAPERGRQEDVRRLLSEVGERARADRTTGDGFERPDGLEVVIK